MMKSFLLTLLLALSGCQSNSYDLSDDYRPLERIKETSLRSGEYITTIGDTVYVNNLESWLEGNPVDSLSYRASLRHEQEHSIRQFAYGVTGWISKYMTNTSFMWEEEKMGWYYEITILRDAGATLNPAGIADFLSNYSNLVGHMVSKEDALVWINDVLAGRWQPAR